MIAGKLTETIEIHRAVKHRNEYGEIEDTFEKSYKTKAQAVYGGGSRAIDNNEIFNEYKLQFIVRIYHDICENDRVLFNNKYYQIEAIEVSKQYQLKKLHCSILNE